MASNLGRILPVKKHSYSLAFKRSVLNCWGSNPKVRGSPKLLGFSASIAVFGLGAQFFRTDSFHQSPYSRQQNNPFQTVLEEELETRSSPFLKNDNQISLINSLQLLGLITPVSCAEDSICDCNTKAKPLSASDEKQKVCVSESNDKSAKCDQQSSKGTAGGNAATQTKKAEPKKPSNKSCNTSSSSGCNHMGGGIDIEVLSSELGGLKQIDWVIESDLSHCHLIRQASQFNVDSVTRILTEAASAYEDYHMEYRRLIKIMMDALEDSRKACGADLEVIDCKLMLIRSKLDEMKNKIMELDMFMGSLEKLGMASAETAFMAHAEYASVAMAERLQSMGYEVKRLRDETKEMERDMVELQSLIIVEAGKSLK
ncbi:hypothetical protein Ocin01_00931 [Orchesella cincta]|uniref:Uncharacterized protein n=1 Tax=Orchesella cincta TaxID=48709 RepID=A0A1D2NKG6_ORCCI|nr:hypothetical protein Ocin01_00931 [Orchesella cincta]